MKVLIAEDDPISRRLLESKLVKWGYDVIVTSHGKEALEKLKSDNTPGLAILDWMMPEMDGVAVCREVRKQAKEPYIYILLLTAKGRKEDIIEGMDAGADDYITKPFYSHELEVRLRAGRRIVELQEELISARESLRIQATRDALTGVWNRAAIVDQVRQELSRAGRERTSISIIMADLDHFKKINDTYGHMAGDAVLREATRRMQSVLRIYDQIGRYGGEEFLIILPGCNKSVAFAIADRLRKSIGEEAVNTPEGIIHVTCSLGVTVVDEAKEEDIDQIIKVADTELYRAKEGGRNRVEVLAMSETGEKDMAGA